MKRFVLTDNDNNIKVLYEIDKYNEYSIMGKAYNMISLYDDGSIYDKLFSCDFYIKWDECSHFNFNGEDYDGTKETIDAYYHLCGAESYNQHLLSVIGARLIAKEIMKNKEDFEDMLFGLPSGYSIRETL